MSVSIAALRTTRALRQAFLEHLIRQEIWHFDEQGQGATAAQVTTNGNRVNTGIAEKLSLLIQSLSMFFSAFIVALAVQWKLTLITITIVPAIVVVTVVCVAMDAVIEAKLTKIYSTAAVLAEEAFSSVRTVHAFWAHSRMIKTYGKFLDDAYKIGMKKSPIYAALFSTQNFCIYSGVALAYWKGYRMYASGEISSVGTVFT